MNIFVLSLDPSECARFHADQHVGKMYLEAVQLLCGAHPEPWTLHDSNSIAQARRRYIERSPRERLELGECPYLPTHLRHPCSLWARASQANYDWLLQLATALGDEFEHRFGKRHGTDLARAWCAGHPYRGRRSAHALRPSHAGAVSRPGPGGGVSSLLCR